MTFWIITSLMALSVAFLIALALLRVRSDGDPAAASDLQVYRDQLKDVDRDLARGIIAPEDAERIRTEVSRRILAADAKLTQSGHQAGQPRAVTLGAAAAAGIVVIGGAMALYQALGAPGYPDVGLSQRIAAAQERSAARPRQTEAEARMPAYVEPEIDPAYAELIARLRTTVAERGDDLQGLGLLAEHEANLGNYVAAHAAKARQIALKGAQSTAIDHAELAEMLIAAAGGYVSPEAEEHLQQALSRDPWVGPARYYWGLMLMQNDRPDLAFRIWEQTLRAGPPTAPWIAPIRDGLPEAAWRAGVEYELPPAVSAPQPPRCCRDPAPKTSLPHRT